MTAGAALGETAKPLRFHVVEREERLQAKYERELLKKYKITDAELDAIWHEAFSQQWPLPSR